MANKTNKKFVGVEALKHDAARRKNIPTAEFQSLLADDEKSPIRLAYERRNRDLDPQLVWRGKDAQDAADLAVQAPPLYIQEKLHPKVLIDDLLRQSSERAREAAGTLPDLFGDFNGLPPDADKTDFYAHEQNWSNRMILGDSLQVMASLAEREGLRGKVQCIYLDPPYGIKFNSNFQWSTTSRDVKDGNREHISREPEQVKAFRDTWRDGIHSYLSYLRDRLTVARDLLADSGSIFVQIGHENVHRVRAVLDEVFGDANFVADVIVQTTTSSSSRYVDTVNDYVLWYARDIERTKYRPLVRAKVEGAQLPAMYNNVQVAVGERRRLTPDERTDAVKAQSLGAIYRIDQLTSQTQASTTNYDLSFCGQVFSPGKRQWATPPRGMQRLIAADRVEISGTSPVYVRYIDDYPVTPLGNLWTDTSTGGFTDPKVYVVQTATKTIQRCLLMTTDPGDLVLDPTCGSGTTAYVAEQWGRRWIAIDTSRVALALARARIMGARYPYYLLADSPEGQAKEAEVARSAPRSAPTRGDIRAGFVYERVPHVTLKSIANNAEIDVIWEQWQVTLEPLRAALNKLLKTAWEEWQVPRAAGDKWPARARELHAQWWDARMARQREIDASIAARADSEFLYDRPYEDRKRVRVAGPFTVESLSPHRVLAFAGDPAPADGPPMVQQPRSEYSAQPDFATLILDNLRTAGVQQAHKEDRIVFTALVGWPGEYICAEGRYLEGEGERAPQRRAGILIGPEFGTVSRPDLVAAAREAADAGFDVLIACAFNFEAHASDFEKLGKVPVLKARMNPDLHMAGELKNTGAGNLFVIFGEPDIRVEQAGDGMVRVRVKGVDVFRPQTGEIESGGTESIALWMIDTDYNEESFFVRHAYFLGANDPYKALKTTLRAEIDAEAWASLHSDVSRPFPKPRTGRIAVKAINHLGDEVMKVFAVK